MGECGSGVRGCHVSSPRRCRQQRVDGEAAAELIMAADRDFNQAVADRDMNRFLALVAETATFNGGTAQEIHGRDAVGKAWAPFFRVDGPRLTWKPTKAEVLVGGDVGYTVGTWERRARTGSGQTKSRAETT